MIAAAEHAQVSPGAGLMSRVEVAAVRAELRTQGVSYLTVSEVDGADPHVVVCLHGNAGQAQQIEAVRILRGLDGVRSVEASPVSWTILVIRFSGDLDV